MIDVIRSEDDGARCPYCGGIKCDATKALIAERDRLREACRARVADWDNVTQPGAAAEGCPDPHDVALARAALEGRA